MSESTETPGKPDPSTEQPAGAPRPVWRSPSVLVAALVMLIGLGVWLIDVIGGEPQSEPDSAGMDGMSSLTDSQRTYPGSDDAGSDARTPVSPVAFRLGAGYLGGFFLGWAFRKFITLTLVAAGGLVALLALFQGLGWFEVNWGAVEGHLKLALMWVQGQAGSFKTFVTGYLPSAGAASAGLFVGFRRR